MLETRRQTLESGASGDSYARRSFEIDATVLGLPKASLDELQGGSPETNAELAVAILAGANGPRTDLVVLNAAAALVVAGLADDCAGGVELARSVLSNGAAQAKLGELVRVSREAADDGLL